MVREADGGLMGWSRGGSRRQSQRLGLAVMLALFFSTQNLWALNLDEEIQRRNESANQISTTLGRDRAPVRPALPSLELDADDDYKVQLIPKKQDKSG